LLLRDVFRWNGLAAEADMVTTRSMRRFSLACMDWAEHAENPSDRQVILNIARSWLDTARLLDTGSQGCQPLPDLRRKLN
jgi:hypothetical protein